jgi:hypothetical protein
MTDTTKKAMTLERASDDIVDCIINSGLAGPARMRRWKEAIDAHLSAQRDENVRASDVRTAIGSHLDALADGMPRAGRSDHDFRLAIMARREGAGVTDEMVDRAFAAMDAVFNEHFDGRGELSADDKGLVLRGLRAALEAAITQG